MLSEVFSTMFTAQFKEKTAEEVPLPGKKSAEIKEMLPVIYPTSAKPIDESNYAFLLDLAKEYMMSEKCENYLISRLITPDYYYTTCAGWRRESPLVCRVVIMCPRWRGLAWQAQRSSACSWEAWQSKRLMTGFVLKTSAKRVLGA